MHRALTVLSYAPKFGGYDPPTLFVGLEKERARSWAIVEDGALLPSLIVAIPSRFVYRQWMLLMRSNFQRPLQPPVLPPCCRSFPTVKSSSTLWANYSHVPDSARPRSNVAFERNSHALPFRGFGYFLRPHWAIFSGLPNPCLTPLVSATGISSVAPSSMVFQNNPPSAGVSIHRLPCGRVFCIANPAFGGKTCNPPLISRGHWSLTLQAYFLDGAIHGRYY
jgi:hypothetical protein